MRMLGRNNKLPKDKNKQESEKINRWLRLNLLVDSLQEFLDLLIDMCLLWTMSC